jgi:hypothetical protein
MGLLGELDQTALKILNLSFHNSSFGVSSNVSLPTHYYLERASANIKRCEELIKHQLHTLSHLLLAQRSSADWQNLVNIFVIFQIKTFLLKLAY